MNDSKNLILAVVLSALVLLGWTWAANKYFPTANPPSTKIEAASSSRCRAAGAAVRAGDAQSTTVGRGGARREPARRDPYAIAAGLDQPQGRADRRSAAAQPAADDRKEFTAGAPAVAARSAGRLYRPVRLDRPGRQAPTLDTVWTADSQAVARPSGHAERRRRRTARATRSRSRSTTAICSRSSRACSTALASR